MESHTLSLWLHSLNCVVYPLVQLLLTLLLYGTCWTHLVAVWYTLAETVLHIGLEYFSTVHASSCGIDAAHYQPFARVPSLYPLCMYMVCFVSVQWKEMFAERFRIRRNWRKGYCNVRTFEGHTQGMYIPTSIIIIFITFSYCTGISCIQFDNTRIVSGSWDKTIKVIV